MAWGRRRSPLPRHLSLSPSLCYWARWVGKLPPYCSCLIPTLLAVLASGVCKVGRSCLMSGALHTSEARYCPPPLTQCPWSSSQPQSGLDDPCAPVCSAQTLHTQRPCSLTCWEVAQVLAFQMYRWNPGLPGSSPKH